MPGFDATTKRRHAVSAAPLLAAAAAALLLVSCGRPPSKKSQSRGFSKHYSIGPLSVEMRFSARKITMADFLDIDLVATGPAAATLLEPEFDGPLRGFAVYARTSSPPELGDDGRAIERFHIVLAPNGTGKRVVQSIRFEVRENDGSSAALSSKPVEIEVVSVLDGKGDGKNKPKPADIAPDIPDDASAPRVPGDTRFPRWTPWLAALALALLAFGIHAAATRGNRGRRTRR